MSDGIRDAEGKRPKWLTDPNSEHTTEAIALQRAVAYVELCHTLLARWTTLFPSDAWTDPITAVDRMAMEITDLRHELEQEYARVREGLNG